MYVSNMAESPFDCWYGMHFYIKALGNFIFIWVELSRMLDLSGSGNQVINLLHQASLNLFIKKRLLKLCAAQVAWDKINLWPFWCHHFQNLWWLFTFRLFAYRGPKSVYLGTLTIWTVIYDYNRRVFRIWTLQGLCP